VFVCRLPNSETEPPGRKTDDDCFVSWHLQTRLHVIERTVAPFERIDKRKSGIARVKDSQPLVVAGFFGRKINELMLLEPKDGQVASNIEAGPDPEVELQTPLVA
jgi:hypothetical protein